MCQPAHAECVTKTTLWYVWAILFIFGLDMHDQPLQRFSDHSDKCWYLQAYSLNYSWAGSSISWRWSRNSEADWSQLLQCVTTVYGSIRNVGHNYTFGEHYAFLIEKKSVFPLFKCNLNLNPHSQRVFVQQWWSATLNQGYLWLYVYY